MSDSRANFPPGIQRQALDRQRHVCASCGELLKHLGEEAREHNPFGDRAEAHHVIPCKPIIPHTQGGPATVENCVVLCRTCHYSAHQGGVWGDVSIYKDVAKLPMNLRIAKIAALYPFYNGKTGRR